MSETISGSGPRTVRVTLSGNSAVRIAAGIFLAFFLVGLARNIPDTLTRVTLGIAFAMALDPVVSTIQQRLRCSRYLAVFAVAAVAVLLFSLLIAVVGPRAVEEARTFSADIPETVDKLTTLPIIGGVLDSLDAPERIRAEAHELPTRIDDQAVANVFETLIGGLMAGITVIVVAIAVLADGSTLASRIRRLIPKGHRSRADRVGAVLRATVGRYFAGSLLVAGLAATYVLTVGLALGVPLAPLAAVWVLVVSLIPQIGGFLSGSVFTILGFAESPGTGVLCLVLYVVYMNIENHVIQPVVVGKAVNLSAPATMLAALIGAATAGVPGAIIATPLVGTVKALWVEIRGNDPESDPDRSP